MQTAPHACTQLSSLRRAAPLLTLQSLRQQLQGPARLLASKRKAHELFDAPLSSGNSSISAGLGPGSDTVTAGDSTARLLTGRASP